MYSCHCVFTNQFIFRAIHGANLEYHLSSTNQSAEAVGYNLKMVFLTFKRDVIFSLFHILSMRLQAEWSFHFPENVL